MPRDLAGLNAPCLMGRRRDRLLNRRNHWWRRHNVCVRLRLRLLLLWLLNRNRNTRMRHLLAANEFP